MSSSNEILNYAAVVEKECEDEDGNPVTYRTVEPVLTSDLTEAQKKALSVIKKGRDGFEVKPYDKVRALELLGKYLGLFDSREPLQIQETNLLQAILEATGQEVDTGDVSELQQASAAGNDLVESTGAM